MAQVAVLSILCNAGPSTASVTAEEAFEIQQCEKLVKFCEAVHSGTHARIKPPQPTTKVSASNTISHHSHGTATGNGRGGRRVNGERRQAAENLQSFQANSHNRSRSMAWGVPGLGIQSPADTGALSSLSSVGNGVNTAIDPVVAKIQQRRQRLELDLREQVQKRAIEKAAQQTSEFLCCVDLADVLAKPLAPATPPAAPSTDNAAANAPASSDSFDDNTFYSSQHDTPDSHQTSHVAPETEDDDMREGSPYEPQLDPESLLPPVQVQPPAQNVLPPQSAPRPAPSVASTVPGLLGFVPNAQPRGGTLVPAHAFYDLNKDNTAARSGINMEARQSQTSTGGSRSAGSGSIVREAPAPERRDMHRFGDHLLDQSLSHRGSPLVRAHNLSPVAPQPEHVSLLVTGRSPALGHQETTGHEARPLQVAALRNAQSAGSSPDNSPQAHKPGRKTNKKNKRKADRLAADTAVGSPYIKSEPRSPSPMSSRQHARPNKRQKQGQGQGQHASEPIYVDGGPNERSAHESRYRNGDPSGVRRPEAVRTSYEPRDELHPRYAPERSIMRYDRQFHDDGRQATGVYRLEPGLQDPYAPRQVVRERVIRTVSQPFIERPYGDMRPYSRDARDAPALGAPVGLDRVRSRSPVTYEGPGSAMVGPRTTGRRIIVDELGREYVEPPRPGTVIRESVGHGRHHSGSNLEYDPLSPARAMPRRPEQFEEDDKSGYRRPAPAYTGPRRVLTQPDLSTPEYHAYRDRDYGAQSLGPSESPYLAARGELRSVHEPPRELSTRAASVRPAERYDPLSGYEPRPLDGHARAASVRPAEPIRYEASHGYERRLGLMEEPVREYPVFRSSSVRPPETVRYSEMSISRDYRVGSVRPETQMRELAGMERPPMYRESMPPPPPPESRPGYSTMPHVSRPGYDPRQPEPYRQEQYRQEQYRQEQPFRNNHDDDVVYMPQGQYYK